MTLMGFEPQTFRPTVRRANPCATGSCSIFAVQMHIKIHTAQLSGQRGEVSPTVCLFAFSQRLCVAFFFFIKSGGLLQAQLVLVLHGLWGVAVSVPNEMF